MYCSALHPYLTLKPQIYWATLLPGVLNPIFSLHLICRSSVKKLSFSFPKIPFTLWFFPQVILKSLVNSIVSFITDPFSWSWKQSFSYFKLLSETIFFCLPSLIGVMAASALPLKSTFRFTKAHYRISPSNRCLFIVNAKPCPSKLNSCFTGRDSHHPRPLLATNPSSLTQIRASSDADAVDEAERLLLSEDRPIKFTLWVLLWASLSLAWFALSKDANAAAVDSLKASSFGLKIADSLRKLGWPDEFVVFSLATLPVLELRGAIPVGYWLQLNPPTLTVLSILGLVLPLIIVILL